MSSGSDNGPTKKVINERTKRTRLQNYSFWRNLKRNCKVIHRSAGNTGRNRGRNANSINKLNEHHLTIDQLVARRKLEQLRLLTQTDLAILNSAEPYRVSSHAVFRRNLLDPTLHLSVCMIYLLCKLLTRNSNHLSFVVLFTFLFFLVNRHIESFRSFVVVDKSVDVLSNDHELRRKFLSTHLGYDPRTKRNTRMFNEGVLSDLQHHATTTTTTTTAAAVAATGTIPGMQALLDEAELLDGGQQQTKDSFRWINKIILFFWPYLSHLIHFELNEFFRDKIESGSMARSDEGTKRLFYAIIRQLDTNVLVIEKCQLGAQTPLIKNLEATEGTIEPTQKQEDKKRPRLRSLLSDLMSPISENSGRCHDDHDDDDDDDGGGAEDKGKTLIYNLNLVYNGDMDISVIYRYFCCCSSRVGLKDVFLRFNVRITLGPIRKEVPFIDEVCFTLLELPDFGYKGIALAELAELKIVRKLINRIIKDHLLHPRKVTVSLRELFETLVSGPRTRRPNQQQQSMTKRTPAREESTSRIEPHPGKIISSQERPISVSSPTTTSQRTGGALPLWTKLQANALICGCMSANFLLRCCQCWRRAADDSSTSASPPMHSVTAEAKKPETQRTNNGLHLVQHSQASRQVKLLPSG